MRRCLLALALSFSASLAISPASAQSSFVGTLQPHTTITHVNPGAPQTFIDLSHPLNANDTLTTATVHWYQTSTSGGCGGAFKLKFLRPLTLLGSFSVIADRGPFTAAYGFVTVNLNPPVIVQRGDLIAVTQLQPSTCGGVLFSYGPDAELTVASVSDPFVGSTVISGTLMRGEILQARASTESSYLGGVVPVVGNVHGNFGSFFHTSLQLTNPDIGPITGTLVFHPISQPPSNADPSLNYTLASGQTLSYADIGSQLSANGFGSLDVFVTSGARPVATARIYDDSGIGTNGFTETLVAPEDALTAGEYAVLQVPADLTNFRMNVGVRALDLGAFLSIVNLSAAGIPIGSTVNRTIPANTLQQLDAASFIGGSPIAGGWLSVQLITGNAVVYATTTDNRSNDSSMKVGGRD